MFAFDRSALTVLAPLALLAAAAWWFNRGAAQPEPVLAAQDALVIEAEVEPGDQTVAANLPSR